jgi:hypothetical protein
MVMLFAFLVSMIFSRHIGMGVLSHDKIDMSIDKFVALK